MTEVARSICPVSAQSKPRVSRTQVAYWRPRLEKARSKTGMSSPYYSVRVNFKNRRVRFPLHTPSKDVAASAAAKIFTFLVENGWEETLDKFKPTTNSPPEPDGQDTVGDLIAAALKYSTARERSLREYVKAFRRIVSQIVEVPDAQKHVTKNKGNAEWQATVDAVPLSEITPSKVQSWKAKHLKKEAAKNAASKRKAIVTVNSLIRNARALFAKKLLPFLQEEVALPSPLPFEGVTLERPPSVRYRSKINAKKLIKSAGKKLKNEEPEAYKIFVLALLCGLRVSEIDYLQWTAFDFKKNVLRIKDSEYHQLKSEDSEGDIDLSMDLKKMFSAYSKQATGEFVIESAGAVKRSIGSYRCQAELSALITWLKKKGVDDRKPIHTLRKEVGAIIASAQGIYAASRYLRHASIGITAAIYADKKNVVIPTIAQKLG